MQEILKELQAFITDKKSNKVQNSSTAENNQSHDATVSETLGDPPSKKAKLEPIETVAESEKNTAATVVRWRTEDSHVCVVCLGILQGLCEVEQAVKVCVHAKYSLFFFFTKIVKLPKYQVGPVSGVFHRLQRQLKKETMSLTH